MAQTTSNWRAAIRRGSLHPLVPAAIGFTWFVVVATVALVAPPSVRNELTVGAGALLLVGAYWLWPKPTLLVFAFALLLEVSLGRWVGAEAIAYGSDRRLVQVCVDAAAVARAARARWLCFDAPPKDPAEIAEVDR